MVGAGLLWVGMARFLGDGVSGLLATCLLPHSIRACTESVLGLMLSEAMYTSRLWTDLLMPALGFLADCVCPQLRGKFQGFRCLPRVLQDPESEGVQLFVVIVSYYNGFEFLRRHAFAKALENAIEQYLFDATLPG